uniref:Uncharacterized protein n=1 Tax=Panagrolaimus sp. PS1159 TaxID=55785 RepID=A0AC35FJB3_9BILA
MEDISSEYAKEQDLKHKRKIILPCVIPWEYGSNKYASQKGQGGFGKIRNTTIKIESSKQLSDGNNGEVPFHMCPTIHEKGATQAGQNPFGSFRETSVKVQEHNDEDKKKINDMLVDPKATERILTKFNQPNPEAKNGELYGKRRNNISESVGGRRFTQDELNKSRGGFQAPRDVVNTNYYTRLMHEKDLTAEQLYKLRKAEKERKAAAAATKNGNSETEENEDVIKEEEEEVEKDSPTVSRSLW